MKRTARTVGGDGQTTIRRRPLVTSTHPSKNPEPLNRKLAKTLFGRAQIAFDVTDTRLAEIAGIDPHIMLKLLVVPDSSLGDNDAVMERLLAFADARIGTTIALRSELQARLHKSRLARIARRELIKGGT